MKINLKGAVRNFTLGKGQKLSPLITIYEAIVNSIQSNSTNITLTIERNEDLTGVKNEIAKIEIQDNGEGFTKDNVESFLTLNTEHKISQGCKGVGRLAFLKIFKNIKIQSSIKSEAIKREFDFNYDFTANSIKEEKISNISENKTIITFTDCIDEKVKISFPKDINSLKEKILNHILILLYFKNKDFTITINMDDEIETISKKDIPQFKQHNFSFTKQHKQGGDNIANFSIHYFIEKEASKKELVGFFCANERSVVSFEEKKTQFLLPEKVKTYIFITSEYLENKTNKERTDFSILETKEEAENDMFNFLSWEEIRKKTLEELFTIFKTELPEIENKNKEVKEKIQNNYPHLLRYINFDKYGFLNYNDLIDEAKKTIENKRKNLDKFFNNFDNSRIEENITLAEEIIAGDLSSYVIARQHLIDLFERYGNEKENDEKKIHNAILQKGKEGTDFSPIPIRENNLWLLDDKFMSYNYVASEKQLNTLLKANNLNETQSQDRFDIALYSDSINKKRAVLIELKSFDKDYKENGEGINQLYIYANTLKEAGIEEIYLYLIAEVTDKFRTLITGKEGFTKIFSQEGELYQRSYNDVNAFIQVISPKAIISDAKARNKTFIDIIKETCKLD